jgi:hypothetical protein
LAKARAAASIGHAEPTADRVLCALRREDHSYAAQG